MTRNTSLVLLDDGVEWHGDFLVIAHWEKLVVSESEESIPKLVEKNKDKIRKDYFAWVHDLGQTSINGETLVSTDKETRLVYPILDGEIPVLLEEEGEALSPESWESIMARNPSHD